MAESSDAKAKADVCEKMENINLNEELLESWFHASKDNLVGKGASSQSVIKKNKSK